MTDLEIENARLRREVARHQQADWEDFERALNRTLNGEWSMEAEDLADRILRAVYLVGPTKPGMVPWRLTSGGVYNALLDVTRGITTGHVTDEWLLENEATMARYGTIGENRARYAALRPRLWEDLRVTLRTTFDIWIRDIDNEDDDL